MLFIKLNPNREFVFLGDLFDDISYNSPKKEAGLQCLRALEENNLLKTTKQFNSIDDFYSIKFSAEQYQNIESNIKFICGNAELDVLFDIINSRQEIDIERDKYTFITNNPNYSKSFTKADLSLLYKYFSCCYGVIQYKLNDFLTLIIRHSRKPFKNRYDTTIYEQNTDFDQNHPKVALIVGHECNFGYYQNAFINDTSPKKGETLDEEAQTKFNSIHYSTDIGVYSQALDIRFYSDFPKIVNPNELKKKKTQKKYQFSVK